MFHRSTSSEIKSAEAWIPRNALFFFEAWAISSFMHLLNGKEDYGERMKKVIKGLIGKEEDL